MSGGVDSAVALLRAGPHALGVTLRLWLDPAGPRRRARLLLAGGRDRRARDLPRARTPARHARPARGVPARGRRAVRPRLRGRRDAEPVHPLQRQLPLRRAARLRGARRRRAARDRPLRADRRAATAGCCSRAPPTRTRTSRTCSRGSTRRSSTGSGSRSASRRRTDTRSEAGAAGLESADRAESQEACFLAGDDYRDFLERHGLEPPRTGADRRRGRARARPPRRLLALHAGPAARARRRGRRAALRARAPMPRRTRSSSGSLAAAVERRARDARRGGRTLLYRSPAVPRARDGRSFGYRSTRRFGVARGRPPRVRRRRVVGSGGSTRPRTAWRPGRRRACSTTVRRRGRRGRNLRDRVVASRRGRNARSAQPAAARCSAVCGQDRTGSAVDDRRRQISAPDAARAFHGVAPRAEDLVLGGRRRRRGST